MAAAGDELNDVRNDEYRRHNYSPGYVSIPAGHPPQFGNVLFDEEGHNYPGQCEAGEEKQEYERGNDQQHNQDEAQ
jgi:hypothetical protein